MELDLAGKAALVTGASRGLGRAIAGVLHREGCRLVLNARHDATLAVAAAQLPGAVAVSGDVSLPDEAARVVAAALTALGRLDILICNVGGGGSVPPGAERYDEWQRVFALNLWSATNMVETARPALATTRGAIVCISSICGLEIVPGAPVTYAAAKVALNTYVRGSARPLGQQGIRINAVAPGNLHVEGSAWTRRLADDPAAVAQMLARDVSLGRLGEPHEVAELVAYLASPRAGFATGAVWTLDGGQIRA